MGRPTTSNVNAFDRKQSSAQAHSDSAYSHSQASTAPADHDDPSDLLHTLFANLDVSMIQYQGDHAQQKRRGGRDAFIRDSRSPQMCNSAYETQSSMHNVNTTDPFPPTEHKSKEKSGSGLKEKPLMGSLLGHLERSSTATPPLSHPLPSVTSPRSDYQHLSGSHRRADVKPAKPSHQATRFYEPIGPPPTQSAPRKQSSKRSPESGSGAIDLTDIYGSGGLPKSHERSSNTESESFDCAAIYGPAKATPRSEGQRKLSRAVYAASDNTRADRNKLEGIENGSRIRTGRLVKKLAPQDELQSKILGDIYGLHYGREHSLPRL